jgi:hypothetical protein
MAVRSGMPPEAIKPGIHVVARSEGMISLHEETAIARTKKTTFFCIDFFIGPSYLWFGFLPSAAGSASLQNISIPWPKYAFLIRLEIYFELCVVCDAANRPVKKTSGSIIPLTFKEIICPSVTLLLWQMPEHNSRENGDQQY